jgi:hypothetical protein
MRVNRKYHFETVIISITHPCFDKIFKNNLVLLISVIILFSPLPFIYSQIAISLMLATIASRCIYNCMTLSAYPRGAPYAAPLY